MAPKETEMVSQWTSLPGMKPPRNRERKLATSITWLCDKRLTDRDADIPSHLWRIHDGLYDLSRWIDKHPGGSSWLELSQGTDLTEAFECHHLHGIAEQLLPNFFVKKIETPRSTPFTFHENGFFKTVKGRVMKKLKEKPRRNSSSDSNLIIDGLAFGMFMFASLAINFQSYILGLISGIFLGFTTIAAHNYFHRKDNFRIHYFEFSGHSTRDWRIKHVLSHHLYPNSVLDLEISAFEPIFSHLPNKSKNFLQRYVSWIYAPFVYMGIFHVDYIVRLLHIMSGDGIMKLSFTEFVPFILPFSMWTFASQSTSIWYILLMWNFIIVVGSFVFYAIALNGGHHHPEIFHDGDTPRKDLDWGLCQMDAVRDRKEICQNLFFVLTWFGDHLMHHLFPTLDHALLPELFPIVKQTMKEFNVSYQISNIVEMVKGQFRQLAREIPNPLPPGINSTFDKED